MTKFEMTELEAKQLWCKQTEKKQFNSDMPTQKDYFSSIAINIFDASGEDLVY